MEAIVVLAILGGVGYFVYTRKKKKDAAKTEGPAEGPKGGGSNKTDNKFNLK